MGSSPTGPSNEKTPLYGGAFSLESSLRELRTHDRDFSPEKYRSRGFGLQASRAGIYSEHEAPKCVVPLGPPRISDL